MRDESKRTDDEQQRQALAERVGELALASGMRVAVAESLTGGMIAGALAAAGDAGEWFQGSVVAYSSDVKHDLLAVPPGPVVSAVAASSMARTVRRLLQADVAVAVTGAGGPDPQDGREPGTVFVALDGPGTHQVQLLELDAEDPAAVCHATAMTALSLLIEAVDDTADERCAPAV
ncbi:CinA family protein [Pseudonocardia bannensis]|uniref:CinA family protein n=1 Tax=Pseudonocardia bannensis TaxID=630973 RepID=UPI0028B0CCE2|nr:CinA family protein [Pseudonocardia bannensis]